MHSKIRKNNNFLIFMWIFKLNIKQRQLILIINKFVKYHHQRKRCKNYVIVSVFLISLKRYFTLSRNVYLLNEILDKYRKRLRYLSRI